MSNILETVKDLGQEVYTKTEINGLVHNSTSKTTPVDADEIGIQDSASSFSLKKLTWSNLKATLLTYFDTIYTKGIKLNTDNLSIVKNNNTFIKNQCTAWAIFDSTTTPITLIDNFNIGSIITTVSQGSYRIYFNTPMDNTKYSVVGSVTSSSTSNSGMFFQAYSSHTGSSTVAPTTTYFDCFTALNTSGDASEVTAKYVSVLVFGGKQ